MKDIKASVLNFWFEDIDPRMWFQKSDEFDFEIRERFLNAYTMAKEGLFDGWLKEPDGCLALVLLFDQFPRNMFRDTPGMFKTDIQGLNTAMVALEMGFDQVMPAIKRRFLYLPYEHSENLIHQRKSVALFESMKDEDPLGHDYALKHLDVIEKFGRFPHRNEVLGRRSTGEEKAYLKEHGGF